MLLKIFSPLFLPLFQNVIKRNELLIHETRINLKYFTLSDRSHTQKGLHQLILCMWHFAKGKIIGTENRSEVATGWA